MADINIGGRLHSTATGNVVADASEIFDDEMTKYQSQLNEQFDGDISELQRKEVATEAELERIDEAYQTADDDIIEALNQKQFEAQVLVTDLLPIQGSENFVRSGGIYNALTKKLDIISISMSSTVPGMMELNYMADSADMSESYIDDETGMIKMVYDVIV